MFCALPGGGRREPGPGGDSALPEGPKPGGEQRSAPPGLTHKAELVGEHLEEAIAVHGKEDGKVGCQAAPDEEVVDGRPEARVQTDLAERGRRRQGSRDSQGALSRATGPTLHMPSVRGHLPA